MILSDKDIRQIIESGNLIIEPLARDTIQQNGIDLTMNDKLAKRVTVSNEIIDAASGESIKKSFQLVESSDRSFVLDPLQNYLLSTREYLKMPNDLMAFCGLRSTFARLGFVSPLTIIDAGFEGTLTIAVFYGGTTPIKIPTGCRFLHVIFARLLTEVSAPYQGHYKSQNGISVPKALV